MKRLPFTHYRILIWSENPDKLMKFYKDTLKLKLENKVNIPDDYGYMFHIKGDMKLWIGYHSEINGRVKEPYRHMFNLFTNSVDAWYQQVKSHPQAKIVLKPTLTPFATKDDPTYVCTFLDPEGNCWQLMGKK